MQEVIVEFAGGTGEPAQAAQEATGTGLAAGRLGVSLAVRGRVIVGDQHLPEVSGQVVGAAGVVAAPA
jgi:hypothetical protein